MVACMFYAPSKTDPVQSIVRAAPAVTLVSIAALLAGVALLLAARRIAGAITFALPWDLTLIIALEALLLVTAIRGSWRRAFPLGPAGEDGLAWGDQLLGWGSSAAIVLAAVGSSFPGERASDWLVWLPVIAADQVLRQSFFAGQGAALKSAASTQAPRFDEREQVVQQLYRVRDAEGREVIYGTLRADFQAGQRTAVLHVGFCPPLERVPQIEAAPQAGSAATVKVAQALAHGARLDVRLAEDASEECWVWIDLTAAPNVHAE
jgi:hypothetical protein